MAKQIFHSDDARHKILEGLEQHAHAVRVTLGPSGKNVVLEKSWGSPVITKDGVTVSKEVELADPFENMGAKLIAEVAQKISDEVGDGTTTGTVLAEAIYRQGLRYLRTGVNPAAIKRGLDASVEAAVEAIKGYSREVKKSDEIRQVATISSNQDKSIGAFIADAMDKVGRKGVITVEEGKGTETTLDVVEGMQFDKGFLSPYFITNTKEMKAEFEDAYILLHEKKIGSIRDIVPVLEKIVVTRKPLVIIAEDVEGDALVGLVVNRLQGILNVCAVKAPGFGDRRKAMMEDIAALTGGKLISEDLGMDLKTVGVEVFGTADKITITKDRTTIVGGKGSKKELNARVEQIKSRIETTTSNYDREKLEERLAKLTSGVAVIKVGGSTETEMKERKARVDDALAATKAAAEEGIVPGGGVTLVRAIEAVEAKRSKLRDDERFGADILAKALSAPLRQIAENAGDDGGVVIDEVRANQKDTWGYNAVTGKVEDLAKAGVFDPTKVVRVALQSAASIAGLMLTTEVLVTDLKEKEDLVAGAVS
ncbi:MAG: chaperonin GroEL [Planctomycetes bacterium]|nr:chaperonin GroEL [Planctomycetota bacterium]